MFCRQATFFQCPEHLKAVQLIDEFKTLMAQKKPRQKSKPPEQDNTPLHGSHQELAGTTCQTRRKEWWHGSMKQQNINFNKKLNRSIEFNWYKASPHGETPTGPPLFINCRISKTHTHTAIYGIWQRKITKFWIPSNALSAYWLRRAVHLYFQLGTAMIKRGNAFYSIK